MSSHSENLFQNATILLDGNEYRGCVFQNCQVVIGRGNFSLIRCSFHGCGFQFVGEAENIYKMAVSVMQSEASELTPAATPPRDGEPVEVGV